jgi:hypothetical protein
MISPDLKIKPEEKKILLDLNNAINKFHQMIFDPNLNGNVFEFSYFEFDDEYASSNKTFNESKRKKMEDQFNKLIKKCEDKVKLLNLENENLKKKMKNFKSVKKNNEKEKKNYIKKKTEKKKKLNKLKKK